MNGTVVTPLTLGNDRSKLPHTKQGNNYTTFTLRLVDSQGDGIAIDGTLTGSWYDDRLEDPDIWLLTGAITPDPDQVSNPGVFTWKPEEIDTQYYGSFVVTFLETISGEHRYTFGGRWEIQENKMWSVVVDPPPDLPSDFIRKVTPATAGHLVQQTTDGSLTDGEAPQDSKTYGRENSAWVEVTGGGGAAIWGDITGTLSDQTDLQGELDARYEKTDHTDKPTTGTQPIQAVDGEFSAVDFHVGQPGYTTKYLRLIHDGSNGFVQLLGGGTMNLSGGNPLQFPGASFYSSATYIDTRLYNRPGSSSYVGTTINLQPSHAANAFEVVDSDSAVLFAISPNGDIGLHGQTPTQSTGWTLTNVTTNKTLDADTVTLNELADIVGTLLQALVDRGDLAT